MSAAGTTRSAGSLGILEDLYSWEDDALVRRLLVEHPETHDPLIHAATLIPRYFGASAYLSLRAAHEVDGDGPPTLLATIHTTQSPTQALDSLDRFDDDWWLDAMPNLHDVLSFGLRFA